MYKLFISDGNEPIEVKVNSITQALDLITLLNMPSNPDIQVTLYFIGVG